MNYDDLYPRFESLLIEIAVASNDDVPFSLLRDLEFFIMEPYMTPVCKTNTDLAFRIGRLDQSYVVQAIYQLFLARDEMIKGGIVESINTRLNEGDRLVALAGKNS